jgi:outer membrane protein W
LFELTRVILYYFCVKIFSRKKLVLISLTIVYMTPIYSQDFGTKQPIDSTDFYVFTEAGGTYIPSITMNNTSLNRNLSINQTISGIAFNVSGSGTTQVQNFVVQSSVGYNFLLGLGYQINNALGLELEVGYSQTRLTSASFSENGNFSLTGTIDGNNVNSLSTSGNTTLDGSTNLTQIPILIGLSVQNRSEKFQPMASIGIGVCPTFFSGSLSSVSGSFSGTATGPGVSYSISGSPTLLQTATLSSSTAYPFAFKLKAGFDYAFSPNTSLGLRAWAMGLANSDFGDQMESDLYGAIGLNASFKVRF